MDREAVRAALHDVGQRLLAFDRFGDELIPESIARGQLAVGLPGLALAHAYLGQEAAALERLEATFGALPATAGLSGGLAGVGWVVAHLARERLLDSDADLLDPIDEALAQAVRTSDLSHDWAFGLAGILVYACERGARELCTAAADELVARAEWDAGHVWFRSAPDARWLGPEGAARYPEGCFDLGMAHGAAGVIAALRAAATAFPGERAEAWRKTADATVFGDGGVLDAERRPVTTPHRLGWCYGAPGIAFAGGRRAIGDGPIEGLGLCHGAAGVLHMARRLGDEAAAERALATLLAGLPPTRPGLLEGAAGIALALDAILRPEAPAWDRVLLLS